jgi:hypothetical protein
MLKRCRVGNGECLSDILSTLAAAEFHLWSRRAHADEQTLHHRDTEMARQPSGQHGGLIKFPPHEPLLMQGHRHNHIVSATGKMHLKVRERKLQQWLFQAELAAVFEQMDGLT